MASSSAAKDEEVVADETVKNLEGPGHGVHSHEGCDLHRFQLHDIFINIQKRKIQILLKTLYEIAE